MKKCFAIALTLAAAFAVTSSAIAAPVTGTYNDVTGEITVNVVQANNWYVEWLGGAAMTGDAPLNLPAAAGLVTDNDSRIGESSFAPFDFADTLGNVAMTGLLDDDTLRIFWNNGLGQPLESIALVFGDIVDPPTNETPVAAIASVPVFDALIDPSITLDASASTDDGLLAPLSFEWDLDNDGTFEVSTGTTSTLLIADVIATFGAAGTYPVSVQVFDGEHSDVASTDVTFIPEPGTLVLAGMSLLGFVATRRRRNG